MNVTQAKPAQSMSSREKVLAAFERLTRKHGMPPTGGELAGETGLHRATVFFHLRTLRRLGKLKRSRKARNSRVFEVAQPSHMEKRSA